MKRLVPILCTSSMLLLLGSAPSRAYTVTHVVSDPNFDQYLIEEPPIAGRLLGDPTPIPEVVLRSGDEVLISNAGGCVQNDGIWSRYANPGTVGGTIFVSGTAQFYGRFRMLADVLNEPLRIDSDLLGPFRLELGYRNLVWPTPSYVDVQNTLAGSPQCNIPWPRPNQAKKTAYLYVNVFHGAVQADLSKVENFDILPIHGFWNGMPVNPIWGVQAKRCNGFQSWEQNWSGCMSIQDTRAFCEDRGKPGRPLHTRNSYDTDNSFWCQAWNSRIDFVDDPVISIGAIEWEDHGSDDDYSLNLFPARGEFTDYGPRIHFEQNEDETIEAFTRGKLPEVDFWNQFHEEVHHGDPQAKLQGGVGGRPLAVVVGVPSLDCRHDGQIELHPAYAVAVRVNLQPETWAFYYRNSGNMGACGDKIRYLHAKDDKVSFKLPLQPAPLGTAIQSVLVAGKGVKWWTEGPEPQNVWWNVVGSPQGGTVVTIQLPHPRETRGGVAGMVYVNYTYGPIPGPPPPNPEPSKSPCFTLEGVDRYCPPLPNFEPEPPEPGPIVELFAEGPEEMLGLAIDRLPLEQRESYRAAMKLIERQIGFRLDGGAPAVGHAAPLPLSCSIPTPPAVPALPLGLDPERNFPYTTFEPDPDGLRRTFEGVTYCGLFGDLEGFPQGFCPSITSLATLPSPSLCPSTGCLSESNPTALVRRSRFGGGVIATWSTPDLIPSSGVLPVATEAGESLLLVASPPSSSQSTQPFLTPITFTGSEVEIGAVFAHSDFALLARNADGNWTLRSADAALLEALLGEQSPSSPAGGGSAGANPASSSIVYCPASGS